MSKSTDVPMSINALRVGHQHECGDSPSVVSSSLLLFANESQMVDILNAFFLDYQWEQRNEKTLPTNFGYGKVNAGSLCDSVYALTSFKKRLWLSSMLLI
jgi:hypothetical protein